ncbi:Ankyrin repeat domain-containing 50 protein [Pleurostoma richardsiae]|uniref:Ankyrin repeat domain-containing 50 protein n=1 Tax=Pleurostoma richardsiae TaxID=41990 RepID=A0AA38S7B1_9PEZI|nr:Ankyrin repeat domain-containing 50 protein [Pleurostoma richardsiae]
MAHAGSAAAPVKVSAAGLTVLTEPEAPSLDIVFVHGFTGHPERTWTSPSVAATSSATSTSSTDERPSKFRRILGPRKSSAQQLSGPTGVYWPHALLPQTLPDARVLTYGYDTNVRHAFVGPVSKNSLYDHAGDFLVSLEAERRADPQRRLILVAHSLGGLLVKEMLRRSRGYEKQPDFRTVFESTVGIIFFGTPHQGADPRTLAHHVVISLAKAVGFRVNEQVMEALFPAAEYLKQLRDEFNHMIDERGWIIHSFQEQYALPGLFGKKVVEDDSSCIWNSAAEIVQHIGSNHKDMCRFPGLQDLEYRKPNAGHLGMPVAIAKA